MSEMRNDRDSQNGTIDGTSSGNTITKSWNNESKGYSALNTKDNDSK
jgi:hypothetical protein